jgi:small-conductance mechanosensitive channel
MSDVTITAPLDLQEQVQALAAILPTAWQSITGAVHAALDGGTSHWLVAVLVVIAAGLAVERVACWKLDGLNRTISQQTSQRWSVTLGFAVLRIFFDLAGVAIFAAAAWAALYLLVDTDTALYRTLGHLIGTVAVVRIWLVLSRATFAPASEGIRPLTLGNDDAQALHRWVVLVVAAYATLGFLGAAIISPHLEPVLARALVPLLGLAMVISVLIVFVWRNRARIARLFAAENEQGASPSVLRQVFAQTWPMMVTAWFMLQWASWAYAVFTNDAERLDAVMLSWWITLLAPIGDRLLGALLHKLTELDWLQDTGFQARRRRFLAVVQGCVRVILLVVAVTALALTWNLAGLDLLGTAAGQQVLRVAVDIGITLLLAYVLYEVVLSMLDKHMPEEPEDGADMDGEIGGVGATREQTLAPLLRGVFIVLLAIAVVLTVLSSLGIQILPLIAGAGILGLAIGFGSQKLVQDVISGVFFLVDDAFRRGEYINLGDVQGTVEKISVRSMQLRHHMGALHTIPFGEIRHMTNYSRDWAMMKLKLRLTYDTDVEKVRKLIKKLGQELLEDEELGPKFLQPLKSQGVYSMEDDSAVIMRVKFMTRPGEQFEVRKTVYTQILELFEKEGIEFAHRVVSVRIDDTDGDQLTDEQKLKAAGAAVVAQEDSASRR